MLLSRELLKYSGIRYFRSVLLFRNNNRDNQFILVPVWHNDLISNFRSKLLKNERKEGEISLGKCLSCPNKSHVIGTFIEILQWSIRTPPKSDRAKCIEASTCGIVTPKQPIPRKWGVGPVHSGARVWIWCRILVWIPCTSPGPTFKQSLWDLQKYSLSP